MRHRLWTGTFIFILGCDGQEEGLNQDQFEEAYAEAYCAWLEDCDKLSTKHGTMEICLQEEQTFADDSLAPDDCEYDKEKASRCIDAVKAYDECDQPGYHIPYECLSVSDCGGQSE